MIKNKTKQAYYFKNIKMKKKNHMFWAYAHNFKKYTKNCIKRRKLKKKNQTDLINLKHCIVKF